MRVIYMFCNKLRITLLATLSLFSCGDSTPDVGPSGAPYCSVEDRKFKFWLFLQATYLWNDTLPADLDPADFESSNAIMDAVRKLPEDQFSRVFVSNLNPTQNPAPAPQQPIAPIRASQIIEHNNLRIAYLSYGEFTLQSENPLIAALNELAAAQPDEMILDLRDNPGGFGGIARHMGLAVMGTSVEGQEFFHQQTNNTVTAQGLVELADLIQIGPLSLEDAQRRIDNQVQPVLFSSAGIRSHMNLNRLFVLTNERTCSASELLINGFRPYLNELVLIGKTTCGKPLSSFPTTICSENPQTRETFSTATFLISNANNETNYFDGISPTCEAEETRDLPPGDVDDVVIAEALNYMQTGQCSQLSTQQRNVQ